MTSTRGCLGLEKRLNAIPGSMRKHHSKLVTTNPIMLPHGTLQPQLTGTRDDSRGSWALWSGTGWTKLNSEHSTKELFLIKNKTQQKKKHCIDDVLPLPILPGQDEEHPSSSRHNVTFSCPFLLLRATTPALLLPDPTSILGSQGCLHVLTTTPSAGLHRCLRDATMDPVTPHGVLDQ